MAYCRAAITELENMKLAPAVDAERIAALKAGIPKIDVYTEYPGQKPFPRDPPTEIEKIRMEEQSGYPQYVMDKLNQKFKELMGRPMK